MTSTQVALLIVTDNVSALRDDVKRCLRTTWCRHFNKKTRGMKTLELGVTASKGRHDDSAPEE